MCGIAGFSGRKGLTREQAKVAALKMRILGLFNQTRGTHGCGLYVNGEVYKGIDDIVTKKNTKEFMNFIGDPEFLWPAMDLEKGNTMLLHTRQATHGAHTEANTHPFRIKSQDPLNDLVGVHNGTLDNIWTLCAKYGVDHVGEHIHVDSKALYTLIDKVGLKILEEYEGAAALLWAKPSDPNSLFVYHGAARKTRADKLIYGERPMYFIELEEGIYFSSIPNSLCAIRESLEQAVIELEYNKVYQVTDGKFTDFEFEVAREEANLKPDVVRHYPPAIQQGIPYKREGSNFHNMRTIVEETRRTSGRKGKNVSKKTPKGSLVWTETKPKKALNARDEEIIFPWKGRYHRSAGDLLCNGVMWIKDRGVVGKETDGGVKPIWFFHGVMMKNQIAWESLVEESNLPDSWVSKLNSNYAYDISRYAAHPVTHLESESIESDEFFRFSWYQDERRITTKWRPMFSGRCYDIQDGFLVDIIGSNGDDKKTLADVAIVTDVEEQYEEDLDNIFGYPASIIELPVAGATSCCVNPNPVNTGKTTSVYDIVFANTKVMFDTLSHDEIEAMACFVEDSLKANDRPCSNKDIQGELWPTVRTGIATGRTIREALNDNKSLLDSYVDIIKDSGVPRNDLPWEKEEEVHHVDSIEAVGDAVIKRQIDSYSSIRRKFHDDDDPGTGSESPFPDSLGFSDDDEDSVTRAEQDLEDILNQTYHQGILRDDESLHDGAFSHEDFSENDRVLIDLALAKHEAEMEQQVENEGLAERSIGEAIDTLSEIVTISDELQANDCTFAQEASFTLLQGLGMLKSGLTNVCEKFYRDELIRRVNQTIIA